MVKWAETDGAVYLTIDVADCKDPKLSVTEENVTFSCTTNAGVYFCDLKLKQAIDNTAEDTKYTVTDRDIQFHLVKKEAERWNGLLADKKLGRNLVKPDFDKWVDSDDEGAEKEGFDMSQMGGMGGGGMPPGMGGMGGMPGMGGAGGMPGMGGMGGMPGMGGMGGMPGMGGAGGAGGMPPGMDMAKMMEMMKGMGGGEGGMPEDGDDEDDEDDDLPDLEDAEQ